MLFDGDSCSCLFVSLLYGVCEPGASRSQVCRFAVNMICVSAGVSGVQEMASPLSSLAKIWSSIAEHRPASPPASMGELWGPVLLLRSTILPSIWYDSVFASMLLPIGLGLLALAIPLGSSSPNAVCVTALSPALLL